MDNRENLIEILTNCADISKGDDFYIWGAGNTTDLNYEVIENENLVPTAFVDKNKTGKFHNVNIISPDDAIHSGIKIMLISSAVPQTSLSIIKQIESIDMSIKHYALDEIILGRHMDEIVKTYDLLATEKSKKTYYEIIRARTNGTIFPDIDVSIDEYFLYPPFRMRNKNEIFVDCGAFVGDTVEQYLFCKAGTFKKIIAIEPDNRNLKLLNNRVERLRGEWCTNDSSIDIISGAIGKTVGEVCIDDSVESLGTKVSTSITENKVKMYTIDTLFKDTKIDFIKTDIEGFEMDMLEGAKECIKTYHPLLAICLYHKTSDLYSVPLFINKLNSNYKLEIAHHYYDYTDTVLYAYQ